MPYGLINSTKLQLTGTDQLPPIASSIKSVGGRADRILMSLISLTGLATNPTV